MERAATRAPCPVASEVSGSFVRCVGNEERGQLQGQRTRRPYNGNVEAFEKGEHQGLRKNIVTQRGARD